ncbi:MAG: hypothetical protein NW207_00095 [Cytophagales bacterium]|nr:hypothetical protein [Cytophagales bacterium]
MKSKFYLFASLAILNVVFFACSPDTNTDKGLKPTFTAQYELSPVTSWVNSKGIMPLVYKGDTIKIKISISSNTTTGISEVVLSKVVSGNATPIETISNISGGEKYKFTRVFNILVTDSIPFKVNVKIKEGSEFLINSDIYTFKGFAKLVVADKKLSNPIAGIGGTDTASYTFNDNYNLVGLLNNAPSTHGTGSLYININTLNAGGGNPGTMFAYTSANFDGITSPSQLVSTYDEASNKTPNIYLATLPGGALLVAKLNPSKSASYNMPTYALISVISTEKNVPNKDVINTLTGLSTITSTISTTTSVNYQTTNTYSKSGPIEIFDNFSTTMGTYTINSSNMLGGTYTTTTGTSISANTTITNMFFSYMYVNTVPGTVSGVSTLTTSMMLTTSTTTSVSATYAKGGNSGIEIFTNFSTANGSHSINDTRMLGGVYTTLSPIIARKDTSYTTNTTNANVTTQSQITKNTTINIQRFTYEYTDNSSSVPLSQVTKSITFKIKYYNPLRFK